MELDFDEIACFTFMIARAAITGADPPGLIYYFSDQHLATQLHIPLDLLERTKVKCEKFKKIKISFLKRENKYVIKIQNWEKYQHVYMHQKAYRQRQKQKKVNQKKQLSKGTKNDNETITDYSGLVDRIGNDRTSDDKILEKSTEEKNSVFESKNQFLNLLKEFSKDYPYPFHENLDSQIYDYFNANFPKVDILMETRKKIRYWQKKGGALNSRGKGAREQLVEFFQIEAKYQENRTKDNIEGNILQS